MTEHWIVTRTKTRHEHLAAMNLNAQGYDAYVPLVAVDGVIAPLLPNYVFVDLEPKQGLWRPIENTRGCTRILMTGERPSHVPTKDIENLRSREEAGAIRIRTIEPQAPLTKGDVVRITDGSFSGYEGIFEAKSGEERVILWLTLMGQVVPVNVERRQVA